MGLILQNISLTWHANFADYKKGISETSQFLEYFYENLLMDGKYSLRNRDLILKNVLRQVESEE